MKIRNITVGEGKPKICVPVTGVTQSEIISQAEKIKMSSADIAEWRADYFGTAQGLINDENSAPSEREPDPYGIMSCLRDVLEDMPLLVTFRTEEEEGRRKLSAENYFRFYESVLDCGTADMIDLELARCLKDRERSDRLIGKAHEKGTAVIISSHDFESAPDNSEMLARLKRMEDLGGDMLKLAVMPESAEDVLRLLCVTEQMSHETDRPLVTMAMGGLGSVSRICGEVFGSAVTFGSIGQGSAPGQMDAEKLAGFLEEIHELL